MISTISNFSVPHRNVSFSQRQGNLTEALQALINEAQELVNAFNKDLDYSKFIKSGGGEDYQAILDLEKKIMADVLALGGVQQLEGELAASYNKLAYSVPRRPDLTFL
jgi:hypothetical protein